MPVITQDQQNNSSRTAGQTWLFHPDSDGELEKRVKNIGWSSWSNWSTCSRTCDGGISQQIRQCVAPNGCRGDTVRYKICNMQVSVAKSSIESIGKWTAYRQVIGKHHQFKVENSSTRHAMLNVYSSPQNFISAISLKQMKCAKSFYIFFDANTMIFSIFLLFYEFPALMHVRCLSPHKLTIWLFSVSSVWYS